MWCEEASKCEVACIIVVFGIFFVTTTIFGALYFLDIDHKCKKAAEAAEAAAIANKSSLASNQTCTSEPCLDAARLLIRNMDEHVDPCVDFYAFSCGGSPKGFDLFATVEKNNKKVIKNLLLKPVKEDDPSYLKKMKNNYQECDAVRGGSDVLEFKDSEYYRQWPSLNKAWSETGKSPESLTLFEAGNLLSSFADFKVSPNSIDPTSGLIPMIGPPVITEYVKDVVKKYPDSFKVELKKSYISIVQLFNGPSGSDDADATLFVELVSPLAASVNDTSSSQIVTLRNMGHYVSLNIPSMVETVFAQKKVGVSVNKDMKVVESSFEILSAFDKAVKKASLRTLHNFIGFQNLYRIGVGPQFRDCLTNMKKYFTLGLDRQFALNKVTNGSIAFVKDSLEMEIETLTELTKNITWMSDQEKQESIYDVSQMEWEVVYPRQKFTENDINLLYRNYSQQLDSYLQNQENVIEVATIRNLKSYGENGSLSARESSYWSPGLTTTEADIYYNEKANKLSIDGGFLQPPLFIDGAPKFFNYARTGASLARKIMEGFVVPRKIEKDDFDSETCVAEDYSQSRLVDAGAIKHAYTTYLAYLAATKTREENIPLLEQTMTVEQLFFLSFGQLFCHNYGEDEETAKRRQAALKNRVIGTLQSLPHFSNVYNCPLGSHMNPNKRCKVW